MPCGSSTDVTQSALVKPDQGTGQAKWSIPSPLAAIRRIAWLHERWRQRQQLLELDDHRLDDIGLTRDQVREIARKPFWK